MKNSVVDYVELKRRLAEAGWTRVDVVHPSLARLTYYERGGRKCLGVKNAAIAEGLLKA